MQIRKQAIKDLATLCKDSKEYVAKISFALAQILQSDDSSEISIVHNSVATLFQIDALGEHSNTLPNFRIFLMLRLFSHYERYTGWSLF